MNHYLDITAEVVYTFSSSIGNSLFYVCSMEQWPSYVVPNCIEQSELKRHRRKFHLKIVLKGELSMETDMDLILLDAIIKYFISLSGMEGRYSAEKPATEHFINFISCLVPIWKETKDWSFCSFYLFPYERKRINCNCPLSGFLMSEI